MKLYGKIKTLDFFGKPKVHRIVFVERANPSVEKLSFPCYFDDMQNYNERKIWVLLKFCAACLGDLNDNFLQRAPSSFT